MNNYHVLNRFHYIQKTPISALLALSEENLLVNGGPFVKGIHRSPAGSTFNGPEMWSFNVFVDVCLNKWLNKQWSYQWFEMPWSSCDITVIKRSQYSFNNGYEALNWSIVIWSTKIFHSQIKFHKTPLLSLSCQPEGLAAPLVPGHQHAYWWPSSGCMCMYGTNTAEVVCNIS